jgi:hypothetical protein
MRSPKKGHLQLSATLIRRGVAVRSDFINSLRHVLAIPLFPTEYIASPPLICSPLWSSVFSRQLAFNTLSLVLLYSPLFVSVAIAIANPFDSFRTPGLKLIHKTRS